MKINMKTKIQLFIGVMLTLLFASSAFGATARYTFTYDKGTERFYAVEPGGVIKGNVLLKLEDRREVKFKLSLHSMTGGVVASQGSGSALDMSTWVYYPNGNEIYVDGTQPELAGLEPILVPFEITVPENIAPGDYKAALKATLVPVDAEQTASAGAKFTSAIGLPLKISIPGERMHKLTFDSLNFVSFDSVAGTKLHNASIDVSYSNNGNTVLSPFFKVTITNFLGKIIHEEEFDLGVIFPGATLERTLLLKDLEPFLFWLDFKGELSYQIVNLDGSLKEETFETGVGELRAYLVPWVYFWVIVVIFVIIILAYLYTRYRLSRLTSISKIYTVQQNDTLQSVCAKFQIDSKDLIHANKLKAPYFLEVGSKILIPIKK